LRWRRTINVSQRSCVSSPHTTDRRPYVIVTDIIWLWHNIFYLSPNRPMPWHRSNANRAIRHLRGDMIYNRSNSIILWFAYIIYIYMYSRNIIMIFTVHILIRGWHVSTKILRNDDDPVFASPVDMVTANFRL